MYRADFIGNDLLNFPENKMSLRDSDYVYGRTQCLTCEYCLHQFGQWTILLVDTLQLKDPRDWPYVMREDARAHHEDCFMRKKFHAAEEVDPRVVHWMNFGLACPLPDSISRPHLFDWGTYGKQEPTAIDVDDVKEEEQEELPSSPAEQPAEMPGNPSEMAFMWRGDTVLPKGWERHSEFPSWWETKYRPKPHGSAKRAVEEHHAMPKRKLILLAGPKRWWPIQLADWSPKQNAETDFITDHYITEAAKLQEKHLPRFAVHIVKDGQLIATDLAELFERKPFGQKEFDDLKQTLKVAKEAQSAMAAESAKAPLAGGHQKWGAEHFTKGTYAEAARIAEAEELKAKWNKDAPRSHK